MTDTTASSTNSGTIVGNLDKRSLWQLLLLMLVTSGGVQGAGQVLFNGNSTAGMRKLQNTQEAHAQQLAVIRATMLTEAEVQQLLSDAEDRIIHRIEDIARGRP